MSEKVTAMIEEIKALTVLELNELVHALEEEFGVSAAAMAAPAAGGAAPAAHQPAVFPESKTAAAYRGAGGAGTVCGVLRAGVLRVLPVGGKRAVLARVGLVCEMTSAEKTCKEIACGRFFCFWNNN